MRSCVALFMLPRTAACAACSALKIYYRLLAQQKQL